MSFHQLGLSAELLRAVETRGYREPTPVQRRAIPPILLGGDLMARAQTGTGKTAGFTLPLLQRLSERSGGARRLRHVRALILTPTRELAAQVHESVRAYGRYLPLSSAVVFGGVGFRPQMQTLKRGVDVLVSTPGRLLDHLRQGTADLSRVEVLVLDEADRMLDMGFLPDIRKILAKLPASRQNLLFSATFPREIRDLADRLLNAPSRIEIDAERPAADGVSHLVHPVDRQKKSELLSFLIGSHDWNKALVFTRTKRGADRVTRRLRSDGIRAEAIHGDKSQGARTRTLSDFKRGKIRVLVATDIAARGLDIEELPQVVNFELPHVAEDYVHRIGRTGRAGRSGDAVSLVSTDEAKQLADIEALLGKTIDKAVVPGFAPSLQSAIAETGRRTPRGQRRAGYRGTNRRARSRRLSRDRATT
jgi:ATP-dependent RNA helicase RhlE